MRFSSIATMYAALATIFVGASTHAQAQTASTQAEPAITATQTKCATPCATAPAPVGGAWDFKLSFTETAQVYTFDDGGDTLVGFNQSLLFDFKDFDLGVNLPIYTQDDSSLGDIDVHAIWPVFSGDNKFFKNWSAAFGGGLYLPVGTDEFRSENVNPYVNAAFNCNLFGLDFTQTAEYTLVGGGFYAPTLGTKTDSDIFNLTSNLTIHKVDNLTVGLVLDQYYFVGSGDSQVFFGPETKWNVGGFDLHASLLLPVHQDVSTPESEMLLTAGFGFEF